MNDLWTLLFTSLILDLVSCLGVRYTVTSDLEFLINIPQELKILSFYFYFFFSLFNVSFSILNEIQKYFWTKCVDYSITDRVIFFLHNIFFLFFLLSFLYFQICPAKFIKGFYTRLLLRQFASCWMS